MKKKASIRILLVGNPNVGKSTIFNALTGGNQATGNWQQVTVEKRVRFLKSEKKNIELIDLPGIYRLDKENEDSIDAQITKNYLKKEKFDFIINIIDLSAPERSLVLTTELLVYQNVILVANMIDKSSKVDLRRLGDQLGAALFPTDGLRKKGLKELFQQILMISETKFVKDKKRFYRLPFPSDIECFIKQVLAAAKQSKIVLQERFSSPISEVQRILQDQKIWRRLGSAKIPLEMQLKKIESSYGGSFHLIIDDIRYRAVHALVQQASHKEIKKERTSILDRICLHRYLGPMIFVLLFYSLLAISLFLGGTFSDYLTAFGEKFFVLLPHKFLQESGISPLVNQVITFGLGRGITTVLAFLPLLFFVFFFLGFLEESGYMARAALLLDSILVSFGLSGNAIIPLILGFSCNVPGIMATRGLKRPSERIIVSMMLPFIPCASRLVIYLALAFMIFPEGGINLVIGLYILGILVAIATAFLLDRTIFKDSLDPLVLQLPRYNWPIFTRLLGQISKRISLFFWKAGRIIVIFAIILTLLNALFPFKGEKNQISFLSYLGRQITPLFHPMGIKNDNWEATVGLLSGIVAKEVVIGTLNSLYTQNYYRERKEENQKKSYLKIFGNKNALFAYLIFCALYFPCITTLTVIWRELGALWAIFSLFWTNYIAYLLSVIYFQTTKILETPFQTLTWYGLGFISFSIVYSLLKKVAKRV